MTISSDKLKQTCDEGSIEQMERNESGVGETERVYECVHEPNDEDTRQSKGDVSSVARLSMYGSLEIVSELSQVCFQHGFF